MSAYLMSAMGLLPQIFVPPGGMKKCQATAQAAAEYSRAFSLGDATQGMRQLKWKHGDQW